MKALLLVLASVQVVIGALLWLAPGFFFEAIGPYGVRNDHYMGDLATWYLANGAALFVAVRHVSWRVPVLFLTRFSTRCTPSTTCSTSARPTPAGSGR